jgi:S-DNA-T family DNA segregation ATPase FtsK/SpoIIIE
MANRTKRSKKGPDPEKLTVEQEETADIQEVVRDERTQKVIGVFILGLSFFLLVAFISYMFTWQEDQDKIFAHGLSILAPNSFPITNVLGAFGAFVSHFFFFKGFGIASFLFCAFLFVVGVNLFFVERVFSIPRHLKYLVAGLIVFSLTASFVFGRFDFPFGGEVGDLMAEWLTAFIGTLGTGFLMLVLFFSYVIWRFNPVFRIKKASAETMQTDREHSAEEENEPVPVTPAPAPVKQVLYDQEAEKQKLAVVEKKDTPTFVFTPVIEPEPATGALSLVEKEAEPPAPEATLLPPVEPVSDEIPALEIRDEVPVETMTPAEKVKAQAPYDPVLDLRDYKYPKLDLLDTHKNEKIVMDATELEANKNQIISTLGNYDISIQKIFATVGPTVTLYEIVPAAGVRISRIKNLEDDIALSLSALGIRIIAPIPGKGTIGIEVPNVKKSIVGMRTILSSEKFQNSSYSLPIALGKKIDNDLFVVDLATMPHLLMAGATGQGKSVGLNAILLSLLYKKHPSQLKLVLVDPKKVELSLYRMIEKHFLAKLPGEDESIITDTKKVVYTLNALCIEMDNRYDLLKDAGVRNLQQYNEKFVKRALNPQKGHQFLPFIVLVIDEFADLIMTAGKEIETPIARLAQLARAVGIHLIIATQRPSVNIITGTIKANFPARIAFKVSSKIDSRTILDAGGAEQLIGKGDMLISHAGELTRLQCVFVDTPEVDKVVEFIGKQRGYPDAFLLPEYVDEKDMESRDLDFTDRDPLFEEAAMLIVQSGMGSTSMIQRRMKLGYNRAGRLMDQLEAAGIVGSSQGSKAREVLIKSDMELQQILDQMK